MKLKTYSLIVLLCLALVVPLQSLAYQPSKTIEENLTNNKAENSVNEDLKTNEAQPEDPSYGPDALPLNNNTYFYATSFFPGDEIMWVMDVPFNSAKYHIEMDEYANPAGLDNDLYIKFGSEPTTTDYDYKSATSNQKEVINIEVPEDSDYGDMYVLVHCVSGSGAYYVRAWHVTDFNGCWRSADYKGNPVYSTGDISISDTVDATDINDFFYIYVYSGQKIQLDFTSSSGWAVDMFLYDEDHNLVASDTGGSDLDITKDVTGFDTEYYYIRFKNYDSVKHTYSGTISDIRNDDNNRYSGATVMDQSTETGWMNSNDVNDYWYFYADSGQKVTINVTITGVSSPYYDAYLYTSTYAPINDNYIAYWTSGTILTIEYMCGEYYSSEISGSLGNKHYLRIWNAALYAGAPDPDGSYSITWSKTWLNNDDHISGSTPDYTSLGANSTSIKAGSLTGYWDTNDFYKITTKMGYTIKIAVNASSFVPLPYLDGYLIDNTGTIVDADSNFNVTISYTATYDGDYYFRLYEAPASDYYGEYQGPADYTWYIYTSAFDGNDNFTAAEIVDSGEIIEGDVTSADIDDYYQIAVPSGYEIEVTGTSTPTNLELYLYDSVQTEIDSDLVSPWSITHIHTGLATETYYVRVHNEAGHNPAEYSLTITLNKIDSDGEMADATIVPVSIGNNETGSDSLSGTDINDYYTFPSQSGQQIIVTVEGVDGMVVRIVKNETNSEVILSEATISGGDPVQLVHFPHVFYPGADYFVRICNPGGAYSGSYDWNITLVNYDTEDGSWLVPNELEAGTSPIINDTLNVSDANDWWIIPLRAGEFIEIELTSTMPSPHVGFELWGFTKTIYDDGQTLYANITNTLFYTINVYVQVVNEAGVPGDYTLTITTELIDDDNNGELDQADEVPEDTNLDGELGLTDINDFYAVEVKSGYNLTVKYNVDDPNPIQIYCLLISDDGYIYSLITGLDNTLTFINPDFNTFTGAIQFFTPAVYFGYNETIAYTHYSWNYTITIDDPDGDFNLAQPLTGQSGIHSDSLYANTTVIPYNYSDINDFFEISLDQGDVLSLAISISGASNPWFGVYIYDDEGNVVSSATGNNSYNLLFNVGGNAGTYYIRFYDEALEPGSYTMAYSIYTDTDSYFDGATDITPGDQTPDDMSNVDISDFYSIGLGLGWRIKITATLSGSSSMHLMVYNPSYAIVVGDYNQTTDLKVEFTAKVNGTFYIEFYNAGGKAVNYEWSVEVYEDENGVFETATPLGDGDFDDNVQALDKFDYFTIDGLAGNSFTVTCNPPAGLDLELHLYDSTEALIDSDTTGPGLAVTHNPSSDETFYILFTNPTGDSGDYSFSISGVGTPTEPTTPVTTPTTSGNETGFFSGELLGLPIWLWIAIAGGVVLLLIVTVVIILVVRKKKKS
ncbi:MAG: hypothetical protein GF308_00340 [Candidatus Heimdallarchaeota archaeon]|nr:hypothetical protein [Candidatus Heimdallarchaeota archaeon]